jgi:hypothetical protein
LASGAVHFKNKSDKPEQETGTYYTDNTTNIKTKAISDIKTKGFNGYFQDNKRTEKKAGIYRQCRNDPHPQRGRPQLVKKRSYSSHRT